MNRSNAWSIPFLLALVLMITGPTLAHLHAVAPIVGFMTFAISFVPGLIAVFFGVVLIVRGDKKRGGLSLLVGLGPISIIASGLVMSRDLPRINDIATNLDNPPALTTAAKAADNEGKDLTYPDAFKSQVQAAYPDLISLQLNMPPTQAFALVQKLAQGTPHWRVTKDDAADLVLEGEDTDGIFQFTDDFAIRVLPMAGGSQVDVRSRSRVGKGDFGANARRIRAFFGALQQAAPSA